MSKHHTLPPIIYTPPPKPKKIETRKRRAGIGLFGELDETADTREASSADRTGQPMAAIDKLPPQNFAEIEGADRKPHHPTGRLSQDTLSVLLHAQELE